MRTGPGPETIEISRRLRVHGDLIDSSPVVAFAGHVFVCPPGTGEGWDVATSDGATGEVTPGGPPPR